MVMLTPPEKTIRAQLISRYIRAAGYVGVVVFTCGNAAAALRSVGVDVLEVGNHGELIPGKWWTPAEIRRIWPDRFDATSGHLPAPLMAEIAAALRKAMGHLPPAEYGIPTGSGETIICMRWAYPLCTFVPIYGGSAATAYSPQAPLNYAVAPQWS